MLYKKPSFWSIKKATLLVVALVVAGTGAWALGGHKWLTTKGSTPAASPQNTGNSPVPPTPATAEEKRQVETNKTNGQLAGPSQQPPPAPPADDAVSITEASYDNAARRLVVQTRLNGGGWQKCTLLLSQGERKFSKTAETLYQPQFSTCLGFSVGEAEFPVGGNWTLKLSASNGDGKNYDSAVRTVVINK